MIPTVEVFVGATALALHRSSTISLLMYWNVRLVFHIRFFHGQTGKVWMPGELLAVFACNE
jgi:hypothetical protein